MALEKANVLTDDSSFDQSSSNPLIQETNVVTSTSTGVRFGIYTKSVFIL